jgi:membrane-bound serine protease (ClpP class)
VLFLIALVLAIFVLPSPWGIVAVVGAIVLDLVEVGVGLWWNRRRKAAVGVELLIGLTGFAVGELRPVGQVKVNGEIWSANCEDGCDAGAAVVVRAIDGLTLSVAPV